MTDDWRQGQGKRVEDERQAAIERLVRLPLPLIDIDKLVKSLPDAWLRPIPSPAKSFWPRLWAKVKLWAKWTSPPT